MRGKLEGGEQLRSADRAVEPRAEAVRRARQSLARPGAGTRERRVEGLQSVGCVTLTAWIRGAQCRPCTPAWPSLSASTSSFVTLKPPHSRMFRMFAVTERVPKGEPRGPSAVFSDGGERGLHSPA